MCSHPRHRPAAGARHAPGPVASLAAPTMNLHSRPLGLLLVAGVLVGGAVTYGTTRSSDPVSTTRHTVTAEYGDVAVTVGGVGRIVLAGWTSTLVPAAAAGSAIAAPGGQGTGSAALAVPDALFPRASGVVSRLLVTPGETVVSGQRIAVLDDAGAATAAVQQATTDVATARIQLRRMLNPLSPADASSLALEIRRAQADFETLRGGTRSDRARGVRLARRNVVLARHRLDLVLHPRTTADVAAAEAEVLKAEAELAALTAPAPPPPLAQLAAAYATVRAAAARLARLTGPPDPVAVTAARLDVAKADADLTLLLQQAPPAPAAEVAVARAALDAATARLGQTLSPPDPSEVAAAEAELRKAEADLAALQAPLPLPSAAAVASAQQLLVATRLKVANLRLPAPAADVTAARVDLLRSLSDLRALRSGPNPAASAAARAAITTARTRLATPFVPLDIELARVGVAAAGARLSAARLGQEMLTVRAVSSGTVTSVHTKRGSPVDPSTPIAAVSDLEHMAVDVDISEFDAAQVEQGMQAVLSVDALGGKQYAGAVLSAAPTGTDTGGVVTFPVRLSLAGTEGLKAGMNVSVRIVVSRRRHVIQVPVEAVSRSGGGAGQVRVLNTDGGVSRRIVQLGLANNNVVEITDGLRVGERVVLAGNRGGGGE